MDFGEALRATGTDLAGIIETNGYDLKIDFDAEVFENAFGAGEFQTSIGKFLKWFFSSFTA